MNKGDGVNLLLLLQVVVVVVIALAIFVGVKAWQDCGSESTSTSTSIIMSDRHDSVILDCDCWILVARSIVNIVDFSFQY